jgi:hypothetical protein
LRLDQDNDGYREAGLPFNGQIVIVRNKLYQRPRFKFFLPPPYTLGTKTTNTVATTSPGSLSHRVGSTQAKT